MTEDEFTTELQALLDRVRRAQTVPLERLVSLVSAECDGLQMAVDEGEAW